jgi:hypothetical protein
MMPNESSMPAVTRRPPRPARLSFDALRRCGFSLFACALLALTSACTTIQPRETSGIAEVPKTFSHAAFDGVLQRHVDATGRVDYPALLADWDPLDRYYASLGAASPDSHPELFPDEASRLAYWINAYNASVLVAVLNHYPIDSVRDVRAPFPFFFLPKTAGFFLFQRITLGGDRTSFYALENSVVRKRFAEPRIHFALNCASVSCPRLPRTAFTGPGLEAELQREARRFVAEPRNVGIDLDHRRISLSSIFDWYAEDFRVVASPGEKPTLLTYIEPLLAPEKAAALRACADCEVVFVQYEWGLNAQ